MEKSQQKKPLRKENKIKGKKKTNEQGEIPYGREAVKKAILDATEKLLSERNPNEITVREIAKLANIKHPLIHRHFRTKDEVISAVHTRAIGKIESVVSKIESLEGNMGTFFQAVEKNRFRQIALAQAMIDGVDPHHLQNQFPVMQLFLKLLEKRQNESETKFDVKILASILTATAFGWLLYEPFLLAATGLEEKNKTQIRQNVAELLEDVVKEVFKSK